MNLVYIDQLESVYDSLVLVSENKALAISHKKLNTKYNRAKFEKDDNFFLIGGAGIKYFDQEKFTTREIDLEKPISLADVKKIIKDTDIKATTKVKTTLEKLANQNYYILIENQ